MGWNDRWAWPWKNACGQIQHERDLLTWLLEEFEISHPRELAIVVRWWLNPIVARGLFGTNQQTLLSEQRVYPSLYVCKLLEVCFSLSLLLSFVPFNGVFGLVPCSLVSVPSACSLFPVPVSVSNQRNASLEPLNMTFLGLLTRNRGAEHRYMNWSDQFVWISLMKTHGTSSDPMQEFKQIEGEMERFSGHHMMPSQSIESSISRLLFREQILIMDVCFGYNCECTPGNSLWGDARLCPWNFSSQ